MSVTIISFFISYLKYKNIYRSAFYAAFYYSVTMLFFFIILPLKFGTIDENTVSTVNFCFINNFSLYSNINYWADITTGVIFSSCGYLIYKKLRSVTFICLITIMVFALYVCYSLITNYFWHEYIKLVSIPDMIVVTVGILIGFVSATLLCKYNQEFIKQVSINKSKYKCNRDFKDMSEI